MTVTGLIISAVCGVALGVPLALLLPIRRLKRGTPEEREFIMWAKMSGWKTPELFVNPAPLMEIHYESNGFSFEYEGNWRGCSAGIRVDAGGLFGFTHWLKIRFPMFRSMMKESMEDHARRIMHEITPVVWSTVLDEPSTALLKVRPDLTPFFRRVQEG